MAARAELILNRKHRNDVGHSVTHKDHLHWLSYILYMLMRAPDHVPAEILWHHSAWRQQRGPTLCLR